MSSRRRLAAAAFVVVLSATAAAAVEPTLHLDPLPWDALEAPSGFTAGLARLEDPDTDWRVDDLRLRHVGARGETGRWFLRWSHLSFSTGGLLPLDRWPAAAGPDADADWPGESRIAGWGRPEAGILDRVSLPLIGAGEYGLAASLPFASNTLYPFAARSVSLRLHLRRALPLGGGRRLVLEAGRVLHAGAAGEELSEDALAGRTVLAAGLDWRAGDRFLRLGARAAGESSERLEAALGWPLGDGVALTLSAAHELADAEHRLFGTRVGVSLTLRGLGAGADADPETAPGEAPAPGSRPAAREK